MARYADVDKLIWQVQNSDKYGTITKQVFISLLQNSETEYVAPIAHAHWSTKEGGPYCTHCNEDALWDDRGGSWLTEYCPHCGAKMDEVVE